MTATLDDLAPQHVTSYAPPPSTNGAHAASSAPDDPITRILEANTHEIIQRQRADTALRRMKLSDLEAEAEELKHLNDIEEQKEREQLRNEERRARIAAMSGGGAGGGGLQAMAEMFGNMYDSMQQRLDSLQTQQASAMREEISAVRELVKTTLDRPQPNAIDSVRQAIAFMNEIKQLTGPVAAESPQAKGWSPRDEYEHQRNMLDLEMQRLKLNRDWARDEAERKAIEQQMAAVSEKQQQAYMMLMGTLPKITEAIAVRIAEGPQPPGTFTPKVLEGGDGVVHPWVCPVDDGGCGTQNTAKPGQQIAECSNCHLKVELAPKSPAEEPAPPEPEPEPSPAS